MSKRGQAFRNIKCKMVNRKFLGHIIQKKANIFSILTHGFRKWEWSRHSKSFISLLLGGLLKTKKIVAILIQPQSSCLLKFNFKDNDFISCSCEFSLFRFFFLFDHDLYYLDSTFIKIQDFFLSSTYIVVLNNWIWTTFIKNPTRLLFIINLHYVIPNHFQ